MSVFTHDGRGTPAAAWPADPRWDVVPEADLDPSDVDRVVVAAAHPDDESLGAGGLIARLHRLGVPVTCVIATAGERSHPRSPTTDATAMAARRRLEAALAWIRLGGTPGDLKLWGLPDGALASRGDELAERLVREVGDGRRTVVVTPWRHDGHPDHDALGEAGRTAAHRCGARLWQFPVWFWHHADVTAAPWTELVRVTLAPEDRQRKQDAISSHASQVAPLSDRPGDETLLGPALLEHFSRADEFFVVEPGGDDALDQLHAEYADPWGTEDRVYEARKRQLLLALLPRPRFARTLDVGCSTGTLTAALTERSDEVVALDRSTHALDAARRRLAGCPGVETVLADVPYDWPDGRFDLVVVSESGYFLSPAGLDLLVSRVSSSLTPRGVVVLAHWRHPVVGWPLDGPAVHAAFAAAREIPDVVARYTDRDVEMVLHGPADTLPNPSG